MGHITSQYLRLSYEIASCGGPRLAVDRVTSEIGFRFQHSQKLFSLPQALVSQANSHALLFGKTQSRERGDADPSIFNSYVSYRIHLLFLESLLIPLTVLWMDLDPTVREAR
jgi:hypothetical protein